MWQIDWKLCNIPPMSKEDSVHRRTVHCCEWTRAREASSGAHGGSGLCCTVASWKLLYIHISSACKPSIEKHVRYISGARGLSSSPSLYLPSLFLPLCNFAPIRLDPGDTRARARESALPEKVVRDTVGRFRSAKFKVVHCRRAASRLADVLRKHAGRDSLGFFVSAL